MIYTIPLKQIEKIANPFEQISYDYLKSPLTIEELEKTLTKGKLDISAKDDERTVLLKKIANNIINFNEQILHIDFDNMINIESGWSVSNVEYLAAAIYLSSIQKDKNIYVTGKEELINKLFQPISSMEDNEKNRLLKSPQYKKNNFEWLIPEVTIDNDLENPKWILSQNELNEKVKEVPEKLWKDESFVNQYFDKIENEVLDNYDDSFEDYYSTFFENLINSKAFGKPLVTKNIIAMLQKEKYSEFFRTVWFTITNEEAENKLDSQGKLTIKKELQNNINDNILTSLFVAQELGIINEVHKNIPEEIKLEEKCINGFYSALRRATYYDKDQLKIKEYLPKTYFEKKENLLSFMSDVLEGTISHEYNYIFDTWKNDKDRLKELLKLDIHHFNNEAPKSFENLYRMLDDKFKNNKTLTKEFFNVASPSLWSQLPDKLRYDNDMLELAAIKGYKLFHLSDGYNFYKMESEVAKISLVKNNPQLINENSFPKEWFHNLNIIKEVFKFAKWKSIPKDFQEKLTTDKDFTISLLSGNQEIYSKLPLYLKIDKDIVLSFLRQNQELSKVQGIKMKEGTIDLLPNSVWYSKEILVEAIKIDYELINKVPKQYFNEKEFVINLFSSYENQKSSEMDNINFKIHIVSNLPDEVKSFLHASGINDKYSENIANVFLHDDLAYQLENKDLKDIKKSKKKI